MNKIVLALSAMVAATACGAAARSEQASPMASAAATAAYSAEAAPAATPTPVQASAAPIECAIRTVRTANGMRFDAVADGFAPISGEYEFVLTKIDAAGSSDIVQGGEFNLASGQRELLGSAELSLERGARYRARLVLSDRGGELCRSTRRS